MCGTYLRCVSGAHLTAGLLSAALRRLGGAAARTRRPLLMRSSHAESVEWRLVMCLQAINLKLIPEAARADSACAIAT